MEAVHERGEALIGFAQEAGRLVEEAVDAGVDIQQELADLRLPVVRLGKLVGQGRLYGLRRYLSGQKAAALWRGVGFEHSSSRSRGLGPLRQVVRVNFCSGPMVSLPRFRFSLPRLRGRVREGADLAP